MKKETSGGSRIFQKRAPNHKKGVPTYYFAKILPKTAWKWNKQFTIISQITLKCGRFGKFCFVSSRCERFHCNTMGKSIKARMNWHKIQQIALTLKRCSLASWYNWTSYRGCVNVWKHFQGFLYATADLVSGSSSEPYVIRIHKFIDLFPTSWHIDWNVDQFQRFSRQKIRILCKISYIFYEMLWLLNPFPSAEGPVVPETKDFWFINTFGTSAFSSHTWKKWNSVTCDSFIPWDIYIALTIAFFMHFLIKMLIILKPESPLIFLVIVIYTIQGRID